MEGQATSSDRTAPTDELMSTSLLFCDSISRESLGFHLHSALPSRLKSELTHLIKSHGGKIYKRLIDLHRPFYALINPGSSQVPQYAAYVSSRPESERGTVVPYSFVRASITAREILRPVEFQSERSSNNVESSTLPWAPLAFTRGCRQQGLAAGQEDMSGTTVNQTAAEDDGWGGLEPVPIHLHPTIGGDERRSLAVRIAKAGGDPGSNAAEARVILVHEDHAEFSRLRKQYEHSLRTYVEPVTWVARCLAKGCYFHDPIQKTPMSGRKPGADRNDFSAEDDNNLARFIAKRIPDKSEGGRTGNNLYKDLCQRTDIYPWAAGHTWQSWRNRYRKKQEYFDPIIDGFVASRQDNGDSKGEFQYSRGKKRSAPAESAHGRSHSPSIQSTTEVEQGSATSRRKRPRPLNETIPSVVQDARRKASSPLNRATTSNNSTNPRARRPQENTSSSRGREQSPVTSVQIETTDSHQREKQIICRSGDLDVYRASHMHQPERVRRNENTLGSQYQRDNAPTSTSTNRARLPTEVSETAPLMGMDVNMNPLMPNPVSGGAPSELGTSDVYGYESDHDFHAKARDLGLSDYLESGFASTW